MNYDPNFDQIRLDQLAEQCLINSSAKGQVIFLSDSEDNRLDVASWRFERDHDIEVLQESGFNNLLMELLDSLLIYRAQHRQNNSRQGVVYVDNGELHLEWISRDEANTLRDSNDNS